MTIRLPNTVTLIFLLLGKSDSAVLTIVRVYKLYLLTYLLTYRRCLRMT